MKKTTAVATTPETKLVEKDFQKKVDSELANREYFRKAVEENLKEGLDFHIILKKKSLAKGGAEKLASMFKLTATFKVDEETKKSFDNIQGLVCYVCQLANDDGLLKGEGRGADMLARNANDPNKTIKMAQKRAFVDAVIRATGLSDVFTQDLEDMGKDTKVVSKTPQNAKFEATGDSNGWVSNKITEKQLDYLRKLIDQAGNDEVWFTKKVGKPTCDLTAGEASTYIEQMKAIIDKKKATPVQKEEVPVVENCSTCGEFYKESELTDGMCQDCLNQKVNAGL